MTGRLCGSHRRLTYTLAEWCELTDQTPDAVRAQLRRGRLRGKKVGSRWRVYASELRTREGR